ncbi:MAG: altronate dehydrogenase [Gemmatimonadota bacterium]|nr:altronate dehydrogenase [Gemmatimonadota bacterium]
MKDRETILQFGGGKFLRSFADLFIDEANSTGQNVGKIVVVQSTEGNRSELLNRQNGRYRVHIRGMQDGLEIDQIQEVASVSRAMTIQADWEGILDVATSPDLRIVLSNTTEIGYQVKTEDRLNPGIPHSFPARLLELLLARFRAGGTPLTIVPCELIDNNADTLKQIIRDLALFKSYGHRFIDWMSKDTIWLNTLVDRITSDPPVDHPLREKDPLMTVTEPFALWVIQSSSRGEGLFDHEKITRSDDVRPYGLRKVRILNGAHTALVCKAMPMGLETVRNAILNDEVKSWLLELLHNEIIPTIEDRVVDPVRFADACIERFSNPFLVHKLASIAWEHDTKVQLRLAQTYHEYISKFDRKPPILTGLVAQYI